jgi:hypothetical protein
LRPLRRSRHSINEGSVCRGWPVQSWLICRARVYASTLKLLAYTLVRQILYRWTTEALHGPNYDLQNNYIALKLHIAVVLHMAAAKIVVNSLAAASSGAR